ncbi:helix-turn-helix domain-containing protein [Streptomyces sp. NPDC001982]|uniref:helix-turn-helix domain-containing protein n=1 Tax=Streptomyces sp. NPDC001982 TaxID=3154405 RepID=UPI00331F23B4
MSQPPPVAADVAQRRAEALRLSRDGLSLREIGERLGTSKDTAKRDIAAAERDEARQAAETSPATPETNNEAPATPGPDDETPVASAEDSLTVPYDDQLRTGLATLAEAGHSPEDAVRLAVAVLARAYEGAWRFGLYPHGIAPRVRVVDLHPYEPKDSTT